MMFKNGNCPCCGKEEWRPFFQGAIRNGAYGSAIKNALVLCCSDCGLIRMDERFCEPPESYINTVYRDSLNQSNSPSGFYTKHDEIQLERLNMFQVNKLRGARVVDIGCAAGSFLDYISGLADSCVAIEPALSYHESLKNKKFELYESLDSAIEKSIQPVTHAFCFSVIEHVKNPLEFLQQIYSLMQEKAQLIISTPNLNDFMIDLSLEYKSFFFRKAHRWYFNNDSIMKLAERAGFKNIEVKCYHRFGISNMINWMQYSEPYKNDKSNLGFDTKFIDIVWQKNLEQSYRGDYLYITMEKYK
ncbi:class I SAM-dependent methyltransferase [Candidatus Methylopumilus planktonicus]|uniref:class I SAM-dependent methyltransferase n=1 Tax=Candidatus Methylopumilus planktonicus TaxID=1581557 RepID=UPI003BEF0D41